ncbi:MAG: methylated-DNA--[protein]-cysteine S-methyltransferase [Melioribacteraceae bacterium]|nr:methylated-DNA--[protein]-cysteine S-methyltransferase [Melioribacteraceae bacterium]MCF8353682.1 methylated-DNA--[protein]-cysteine S-methyltransferase [Melioribacteraceae bacterium]MCF8394464.1 methylated-DNA--[protein]-cysteine S-methyltransferase [Melioribacteraceae bacterium]MCF8418598.1 methylated-DNA--[protein]-cysteine S-methyltransferase [Melioribacteraceae bacterium]
MQITNRSEIQKYYTALLERDSNFIGTFFVGVKTTGVFCIPTCRARKPKLENVEFFTEVKDVLRNGYRPCKICKPTQNAYQPPADVSQALNMVKSKPKEKINDYQLRKSGMSPEKIRRWFKQHYGITFQAYQRMLRINTAFQELQNGNKVIDSAYESGYESLSGFNYTFKKMLGNSPNQIKNKNIILITRLTTPLGPMYACATNKGICLLEFTDRRMLETEFHDLQNKLNATIIAGENEHLIKLKKELAEYFDGARKEFTVQLQTPGSDFQQLVWNGLHNIEYGKTSSYQQQAESLKKPNAVRAVASANGQNRISIVIPCHRVIGKNGNLTGYGGGLERKKWLLEHEKKFSNVNY